MTADVSARVASTVPVTSPALVIHLVRDLRGILTEDRLTKRQAEHLANSQGKEEGNVVDVRRKAAEKEAEDDIKEFLSGWSNSDIIAEEPINRSVDKIVLDDFNREKSVDYRLSDSNTVSVRAALMHHLEFFATTFYVYLPALERGNSLDTILDKNAINRALRDHIEKNKDIYYHIFWVTVENIEHDYKVYDGLESIFREPIYDHATGSMLGDREVYFWTNFQDAPGNKTKILIRNIERSDARVSRLIRRLLDMCTYSCFIMEAKPHAREQLSFMRDRLREIDGLMKKAEKGGANKEDLEDIFEGLVKQASAISGRITRTRSLFTASVAYWQIVKQRVAELDEQRIASFSRLGRRLEKKVKPVCDNCAMAIQCQTGMAKQVEQVAGIVRTRVDIIRREQNSRIENQNREIGKENRKIELVAKVASGVGAFYAIINLAEATGIIRHNIWVFIIFVTAVAGGWLFYYLKYRDINKLVEDPGRPEGQRMNP